ncbi:MAG: ABC transporter ATP-binding protein [Deltaproteobacteria bacterium]|nr:ABC transporter ATP-binding protein [Deltaproteobacteria bacterium]
MTVPPLFDLGAVDFAYGTHPALAGIDLQVPAGEIVGLVGPNGAGKSTLLQILGGLLQPTQGTARFEGLPLADRARRDLARAIAYVPQEYGLDFPFTAGEVVLMGRYPHLGAATFEGPADREAARAAMERTDVWPLRNRRIDELSGGERRRVVLAQAFCQDTRAILLDEPTASLDAAHELALQRSLAARRDERGVTVILVTHDLAGAARLCDRLVCLQAGRVAADGPTLETLRSAAVARAFGVSFHVDRVPDGPPFVVPLEPR